MSPPIIDYYCLAPEIVASGFGILLMLMEPFVPAGRKRILASTALLGAIAALASVLVAARFSSRFAFYELIRLDDFSLFLHAIIFGIVVLAVLASYDYLEREGLPHGEFYALLLFAATGMGIMAGANELVTAFVGLEISSIASYVMAGWRRDVLKSNESAMKYFLLGSFATAFFLYGVAMVYGSMGTTFLDKLRVAIGASHGGTLLILGMGMMFVGLAFKIATAPFHLWTPDVYEGAPAPVTAFFASAPKAAALAMMLRIFYTAFAGASDTWFWAVWISAALSMFAGNIAALVQTNVKRMLAYSSIAHAGYLMVAFATRTEIGVAAVLFYLVAYALMKLGAFVTVAHLSGGGERRLDVDDYAGLATKRPLTAACLALFLLSLLGLPPTAGFLGKLYVFNAALNSKLVWLAVLLAVNSVIAAYYYLKVIMAMYFREAKDDWAPEPMPRAVAFVLLITAAGTLYFGLFPGTVMNFAVQGASSLR